MSGAKGCAGLRRVGMRNGLKSPVAGVSLQVAALLTKLQWKLEKAMLKTVTNRLTNVVLKEPP